MYVKGSTVCGIYRTCDGATVTLDGNISFCIKDYTCIGVDSYVLKKLYRLTCLGGGESLLECGILCICFNYESLIVRADFY